jgi:hypothetical protein
MDDLHRAYRLSPALRRTDIQTYIHTSFNVLCSMLYDLGDVVCVLETYIHTYTFLSSMSCCMCCRYIHTYIHVSMLYVVCSMFYDVCDVVRVLVCYGMHSGGIDEG